MTNPNRAFPFMLMYLPTPMPTGYGIDSTRGPEGIFISCRGLVKERDHIRAAAERLGLGYGEFIRRVSIDAATYVLENIPE